jgi:transposase
VRRIAVINQIRGLLLERGITLRKGRGHVDAALPGILEDASAKLSGALRGLLAQLKLELDHLQMRIDEADAVIKKTTGENEACRRLVAIPGIGPITATAIIKLYCFEDGTLGHNRGQIPKYGADWDNPQRYGIR